MKSVKKILGIGLIATAVLSLSGCFFSSPSDEERYRFVNEVKDSIGLDSAGEVIDQTYDTNNGIVSPSIFLATINGQDAYEVLNKRIRDIPESTCNVPAVEQLSCTVGQVSVSLRRESIDDKNVILRITDTYSGRESD